MDHGCDWPETREFVKTIPNLTIVKPAIEGFSNLYDYCLHYHLVPSHMCRFCTAKFKIRPLYQYLKRPCICFIGMSADEAHRCRESKESDICNDFPLVKAKMTREGCKQFIRKHGLPVPQKSGCWICPFQRNEQWRQLRRRHPELYEKAKHLEQINMVKRAKQGKLPLTLSANGKRLEVITMEGQLEMWEN